MVKLQRNENRSRDDKVGYKSVFCADIHDVAQHGHGAKSGLSNEQWCRAI